MSMFLLNLPKQSTIAKLGQQMAQDGRQNCDRNPKAPPAPPAPGPEWWFKDQAEARR